TCQDALDGSYVDTNPNAGWAVAMAKILQKKSPESKPSILLMNKQLDKMKEEYLERKKQSDKKGTCRKLLPEGVVQLFNAMRMHQLTMDEKVEVGSLEKKKAKLLSTVSKKDFINVLGGTEGGSEKNLVWFGFWFDPGGCQFDETLL
uniref:RRP15-like protein n=1 Tax=Hucho hucho TaxID=62062 RepID=A0A4W5PD87_9TELE